MKQRFFLTFGAILLLAPLGLLGCDVSLATEEAPEEVMWQGRPVRQWLIELWDEATIKNAQASLGLIGPDEKDMVPGLIDLLKDDDRRVRAGACRLLGQIGPKAKDALKPLDELLVDPDKMVRVECLYARKRIRNLVA
jgi:HEAT repeat protein